MLLRLVQGGTLRESDSGGVWVKCIPQGLKPASLAVANAKAEALAYLQAKTFRPGDEVFSHTLLPASLAVTDRKAVALA